MPFAEDQDMIQTLAPECPDQALNIRILPRRSWCDRTVANSHGPDPMCECLPIGTIIVAHQIGWCRAPGKCLNDLMRQPLRRRVPGHCKPKQLSSTVANDEKRK